MFLRSKLTTPKPPRLDVSNKEIDEMAIKAGMLIERGTLNKIDFCPFRTI